MSHGDFIARLPEGFRACAVTEHCPTGAIADEARGFYGVQFHPEVNHTEHGQDMIRNFLYRVCGCTGTWNLGDYMRSSIAAMQSETETLLRVSNDLLSMADHMAPPGEVLRQSAEILVHALHADLYVCRLRNPLAEAPAGQRKAQRSVTSVLFFSALLPQLEFPLRLRVPLLASAGETGLFPLLLLELQGLLGLGADGPGPGRLPGLPLAPLGASPARPRPLRISLSRSANSTAGPSPLWKRKSATPMLLLT